MAKRLIIFSLAWDAVATILSLVLLLSVAARGGALPSDRLIPVVGTLGICGVVIWAIWNERRRRRGPHSELVATPKEQS